MPSLPLALASSRGQMVVLVARVTLGCLFVYAAIPKLIDPADLAQSIANYRMLPAVALAPLALVLPWIELVVGVALILGRFTRGAALTAGTLLAVFTAGMLQAMARGIDVECGCFGNALRVEVGAGSIARNLTLLLAATLILVGTRQTRLTIRNQ